MFKALCIAYLTTGQTSARVRLLKNFEHVDVSLNLKTELFSDRIRDSKHAKLWPGGGRVFKCKKKNDKKCFKKASYL